jgi:hypothetical protein
MILKLKLQKTPQMKIRQKIDLPQQRKAKIMGLKFKSAFKSLSASVEMLKSKLAKFKSKIFSSRSVLSALEQGSKQHAEKDFNTRYQQTKAALYKAVEEGDTEAQVNFQEQMADMRAAMRVAQSQQQQRAQQQQQQQRQAPQRQAAPAPAKAMDWWQQNNWFNAQGFERETAAARAIDVQLDLEGFDKNSDEYYDVLNNRLQKVFPELTSGASPSRQRTKSRQPVAPTTGGFVRLQGQ